MLSLSELLKGKALNSLPKEHQDNLAVLLEKINKIRIAYNKLMTVTSGYRSLQEHLDIYKRKGITDQNRIPMKSAHLVGLACDIADYDGSLKKWLSQNISILEENGYTVKIFLIQNYGFIYNIGNLYLERDFLYHERDYYRHL